jgi:hypothetical protein
MATILFNGEDIGDAYAPSLNAAFRELYLAAGRPPIVKSPLGGKRTLWEAIKLGTGARSDHYKGRAVDIDNQRWFRNWNEARFISILAKYGWRNVQIDGRPFPLEPWHFANQSSRPAGSPGVMLPGQVLTPKRRSTMTTMYYTTKNDKPDDAPANVEAFYLAGDGAGDAAWIVAPRREVASGWAVAHGSGTHLLRAELPAVKAAYLSGGVTVDVGDITVPSDPALLAELQKITAALTGLPAEIDRYADGRKQAT